MDLVLSYAAGHGRGMPCMCGGVIRSPPPSSSSREEGRRRGAAAATLQRLHFSHHTTCDTRRYCESVCVRCRTAKGLSNSTGEVPACDMCTIKWMRCGLRMIPIFGTDCRCCRPLLGGGGGGGGGVCLMSRKQRGCAPCSATAPPNILIKPSFFSAFPCRHCPPPRYLSLTPSCSFARRSSCRSLSSRAQPTPYP
jgi:hypothetical protein